MLREAYPAAHKGLTPTVACRARRCPEDRTATAFCHLEQPENYQDAVHRLQTTVFSTIIPGVRVEMLIKTGLSLSLSLSVCLDQGLFVLVASGS